MTEQIEGARTLARRFHEVYERLAPKFRYTTRKETAVPWEEIPEDSPNKQLMIAVCGEILLWAKDDAIKLLATAVVPAVMRNVHEWFELTYARWLTIPRVLLDQMPIEWQYEWVKLMDEFNETWDWVPDGIQFYVNARRSGKMVELPEHLCEYRRPMYEELEKIKRHQV